MCNFFVRLGTRSFCSFLSQPDLGHFSLFIVKLGPRYFFCLLSDSEFVSDWDLDLFAFFFSHSDLDIFALFFVRLRRRSSCPFFPLFMGCAGEADPGPGSIQCSLGLLFVVTWRSSSLSFFFRKRSLLKPNSMHSQCLDSLRVL